MRRRQFLRNLSWGSLISISSLGGIKKPSAMDAPASSFDPLIRSSPAPFCILQAASSFSATTLVAIIPRQALITFEIVECDSDYRPPFVLKDVSLFADSRPTEDRVVHLQVDELREDRSYKILCYENSVVRDLRFFSGLSTKHRKFAALSCSNQSVIAPQQGIWSSLLSEKVDALFYLGDSVYANSPWETILGKVTPPEKAYERYLEAFKTIPLYRFQNLIPVFNVWDDHDYASNNGDKDHPHKFEMQQIFRVFFPLDYGPDLEKGPGVSFSMTFGQCRYYFMDNRSFRDYSVETNSLFGEEQKNWLEKGLEQRSFASIVILGSQLFGFGRNRDSVEARHPLALSWLKNCVRQSRQPIAFITGDVHFSHVQKLEPKDFGYLTYEFTSSAMHSYNFPGWGRRSPLLGQMHYCGWSNFNIFEITPVQNQMRVQVLCKDSENFTQYQSDIVFGRN